VAVRRGEDSPFLTLHREMNRLFDDVFRGFDRSPFGSDRFFDRIAGNWPRVEVSETDKEIKVTAELPGLDEKDVQVELANGVLAIAGEKKTGIEDKEGLFSEQAAEDRASAVEGETHHHQWQISRNESGTLPFRRISGGHEHCEHLR
jgi:HSP20 family molecular chaperone IbpA